VFIIIMAGKKGSTTASATGTGGDQGSGGTSGSDNPPIPETTQKVVHTPVIAKIISLCDFPDNTVMVEFIIQQKWTKLFHVTAIGIDEVKDFYTTRSDGSFEAKPMMIHIRMLKCFLLYYKRKGRELSSTLTEDDVLSWTKTEFYDYIGSDDYAVDLASGGIPPSRSSGHKQDIVESFDA